MNFTWPAAGASDLKMFRSIHILLGQTNERFLAFLFDSKVPKLRKRAGILLEDSWGFSHGEQLLIKASLDLWSGSGHAPLWDLIETWDNSNWVQFIQCVCHLKGIRSEVWDALNSSTLNKE